jgi:hypothetical protein
MEISISRPALSETTHRGMPGLLKPHPTVTSFICWRPGPRIEATASPICTRPPDRREDGSARKRADSPGVFAIESQRLRNGKTRESRRNPVKLFDSPERNAYTKRLRTRDQTRMPPCGKRVLSGLLLDDGQLGQNSAHAATINRYGRRRSESDSLAARRPTSDTTQKTSDTTQKVGSRPGAVFRSSSLSVAPLYLFN